jgi:uncharacterized protein YggE
MPRRYSVKWPSARRRWSSCCDRDRSKKLETTGIQLSPRYNYENGRSEVIGYSGSNTVSFRMPTESVGSLLDDAVNAGANQIRGISFVAADSALESARQQALSEAVADAQTQASAVLDSLNLTVQEVIGIQINGAAPPQPIPLQRSAEYASGAAAGRYHPSDRG